MNPKLHFLFYCFSGKSFYNKRLCNSRRHNKGFSLLELQVAIVVLSFGILGLTQSMVSSFEQNSDVLSRTLAVLESKNLFQRMKSHQSSLGEFGQHYSSVGFQQSPPALTSCINRTCSESALADFDVALWHCALTGGGVENDGCEGLRPVSLNADQSFLQLPESRLALIINGGAARQQGC
ncbi:prepilin-type N-terminal cleavage/methylation domain-containing protein [Pseudomonadales bacterium]|nr:prepilin-type N-terminal cleavage/methylation domain-containing protein [Pseudomonadales bacterium]